MSEDKNGGQDKALKSREFQTFKKWMSNRLGSGQAIEQLRAGYGGSKGLWPAEFVQYLYFEGLRDEQITQDLTALKRAFRLSGLDPSVWGTYEVKAAKNRCGRTVDEIRARMHGQLAREKYPIPFEGLWDMREESKAATTRWDETTTAKEADLVISYIVACIMFDVGVRGSNVAVTTTEKAAPEPDDTGEPSLTNQEEEEGEISDEQLELDADELHFFSADSFDHPKNKATGHISRNTDWTFVFIGEGGRETYVKAHDLPAHWEKYPPETEYGRAQRLSIVYPTSKTGKGKGGAEAVHPATIGRRSGLESELLDLICAFKFWNRRTYAEEAFFVRRPVDKHTKKDGSNTYPPKKIRICDTVKLSKRVAERRGLLPIHTCARSYRKGNATALRDLGLPEEKVEEARIMASVIERGAKWVEGSTVAARYYLSITLDIGPFGRVETWEEAKRVGGGWATLLNRQGAIPEEVAARIKAKEDKRVAAETKRNAAASKRAQAGQG